MKISFDVVFCVSVRHTLLHLNDNNPSWQVEVVGEYIDRYCLNFAAITIVISSCMDLLYECVCVWQVNV